MSNSNFSRRRFLKTSIAGAVVVVVAGIGTYFALQPPPSPAPVATPRPSPAPAPAPAAPSPSPSPLAPTPTPTPTPSLVEKAKAEGSVMVYSSWFPGPLDVIKAGFEKKYPGIKMEYFRGPGSDIVQRYLSEHRAGKRTMDAGIQVTTHTMPGVQEGIFASYPSVEDAAYPSDVKDPQGRWTGISFAPQATVYNKDLVKGDDIPKSLWDILKPRFKNKVAVFDPLGGLHSLIMSKYKLIGPERWKEWLQGLNSQNPKVMKQTGPMISIMKTGEVEVGLWAYTSTVTDAMKEGANIDYARKKGTIIAALNVIAVHQYAPHPNAVRLLKDYVLSKESQIALANVGIYVPARPDVPSKLGVGIGTGEAVGMGDIASITVPDEKEMEELGNEWKSIFRS